MSTEHSPLDAAAACVGGHASVPALSHWALCWEVDSIMLYSGGLGYCWTGISSEA